MTRRRSMISACLSAIQCVRLTSLVCLTHLVPAAMSQEIGRYQKGADISIKGSLRGIAQLGQAVVLINGEPRSGGTWYGVDLTTDGGAQVRVSLHDADKIRIVGALSSDAFFRLWKQVRPAVKGSCLCAFVRVRQGDLERLKENRSQVAWRLRPTLDQLLLAGRHRGKRWFENGQEVTVTPNPRFDAQEVIDDQGVPCLSMDSLVRKYDLDTGTLSLEADGEGRKRVSLSCKIDANTIIAVSLHDLTFARPGDKVTVQGRWERGVIANVTAGFSQWLRASDMTIEMAEAAEPRLTGLAVAK